MLTAMSLALGLIGSTSSERARGADSDVNGDGQIDMVDLSLVRDGYGE